MQRSGSRVAFEVFPRIAFYAAGAVALFFAICGLSGCATRGDAPFVPTKQKPQLACAITCPGSQVMRDPETGESDQGFSFRRQHTCRGGGRRWFRDVWIVGEVLDRWLLCEGPPAAPEYKCTSGFEMQKVDVERGSCQTVIAGIIAARDVTQRGKHPGEDEQGRSTSRP